MPGRGERGIGEVAGSQVARRLGVVTLLDPLCDLADPVGQTEIVSYFLTRRR
jgi:hypothetical protein